MNPFCLAISASTQIEIRIGIQFLRRSHRVEHVTGGGLRERQFGSGDLRAIGFTISLSKSALRKPSCLCLF